MPSLEQIILAVPAILLAISFHELGHGWVAYKLGDPTPKYQGRLTLNPFAHLDPLGTLMLVLFRIGWAKPVMINSHYFKNRRQGTLLVSLAGPLANVILGWFFYNLLRFVMPRLPYTAFSSTLLVFLLVNVEVNLGLAAFNLIPIPPLDGSHILAGLLPPRMSYRYSQLAPYGPVLLAVLLISGGARVVVNPIYRVLSQLLMRLSL
ncbi:MAG TPA: site-2 protease family protein [Limnochordia bacterium]|nr:site-2 protease family protein [Limnochordia bacterium]